MNQQPPESGIRENPFQTPPNIERSISTASKIRTGGSYVKQIRTVATLMIINGVLILLVSLAFIGFALFLNFVPKSNEEFQGMPPWMAPYMHTIGGGLLITAVLQIVAGVRNLVFRSRLLGILALGFGLVSLFSAYCFPTSLALAIYGLIVYFQPEVELAFRMRAKGAEIEDIYTKLNA